MMVEGGRVTTGAVAVLHLDFVYLVAGRLSGSLGGCGRGRAETPR